MIYMDLITASSVKASDARNFLCLTKRVETPVANNGAPVSYTGLAHQCLTMTSALPSVSPGWSVWTIAYTLAPRSVFNQGMPSIIMN